MDGTMKDTKDKLISQLVNELTEKTGHEWQRLEHLDDITVAVNVDGVTRNFQHSVRLMHLDLDQAAYANFVEKEFYKWYRVVYTDSIVKKYSEWMERA